MSGKPKLRTSDVLTQKAGASDILVRSGAYEDGGGEAYSLIMACTINGHFILVAYDANDYPLIEKHQDEVYAIFDTMDLGEETVPLPGKIGVTDPVMGNPPAADSPSVSPQGSAPAPKPIKPGKYHEGDEKQEAERIDRLNEIARLLQDKKQDTVALMTEAVRLCGFAIWTEDRAKVAEPLGAPRLKLAITDTEIEDYAEMFRDGNSVALKDIIGMLDVVYKDDASQPSCGPILQNWLQNGVRSGNPSVRALTSFLQSLSAFREGGAQSLFESGDEALDPIQSLLILRVATEEMASALRKSAKADKPDLLQASLNPIQDDEEEDEIAWAEDATSAGIAGLFESISEVTGKAHSYTKKVKKANALLVVAKFIATYAMLKGDIRVEDGKGNPGQPLIRTKTRRAGDGVRTVIAKFWISGTGPTNWLKKHRKLLALAGFEADMPKPGALKGVPTFWTVDQSNLAANQLIQTTGAVALDKVETDAKGEAKVDWEGYPQPIDLDPKKVMPLNKQVWISVTPQVKEIKVQQDLVDAVLGAIGLHRGPQGFVTILFEMLYHLKWNGTKSLLLNVRDWQAADTIGQFDASTKETWTKTSYSSAQRWSVNRKLRFVDVGMLAFGGENVPEIDPRVFEHMSELDRKQMEVGMKGMAELAKKRTFQGSVPGQTIMKISDLNWLRGADGCQLEDSTSKTTWVGEDSRAYEATGSTHDVFTVSVDLEKKIATVIVGAAVKIKFVSIDDVGKMTGRQEKEELMNVLGGLTLLPPYHDKIEIPLKETKVIDSDAMNYYGAVTIPYYYRSKELQGKLIMSYSVTRKVVKKK